jgi:uncharacterized protein (DUF488 family)
VAPREDEETVSLVLAIGHSTRPIDVFVGLVAANGVTHLMDVRTIPKSRHNPQYNSDALAGSLRDAGIAYTHVPGLGGLRRARPDSANAAWRNPSFRGYADYMQTPAFTEHLAAVADLAKRERVALMCAEAVPWRCHRSLIADALVARGITVEEIVSETRRTPHKLTPFARVDGTSVTYPAIDAGQPG